MLWFCIAWAIGVLAFIFCMVFDWQDSKIIKSFGWGLLVALIASVIALFVNLGCLGVAIHKHRFVSEQESLVAISTGSSTHGHFYLFGEGTLGTSPAYNYYTRQSDGSYKLHSVLGSRAKVYEDNSTPSVECWETYATQSQVWTVLDDVWTPPNRFCVFHVPPGSIVQNYSLSTSGN